MLLHTVNTAAGPSLSAVFSLQLGRRSLGMAADRFSFNKSWEQVQNKFVGTGHSDTSKFEWAAR